MANTGNIFPGTGANDAGIGATAWVNPGNIVSDNTTDSTCTAAASSQYLVAKNFNFASVPTNATIAGILARIEASEHSGGTEALLARLQDEAGALTGTGKSAANEGNLSGTAKAVYTYGSTSDVWGATLTGNILHDIDFGVRFWFTTAHTVNVDFVTVAVEYTVPGPGIATETDTALALAITKRVATGVSSETDTALACTVEITGGAQQIPTGVSLETDAAQPLAPFKLAAVGVSTETDSSLATTITKRLPIGSAAETDIATARGWLSLLATEADLSLGLAAQKLAAVGVSSETDSAVSPSVVEILTVGLATETDLAYSLYATPIVVPMGLASEVNSTISLAVLRPMALGLSSETDSQLSLSVRKLVQAGLAIEVDSAFSIYGVVGIGQALETDSALALAVRKAIAITAAVEADSAPLATIGPPLAYGYWTGNLTGYNRLSYLVHKLLERTPTELVDAAWPEDGTYRTHVNKIVTFAKSHEDFSPNLTAEEHGELQTFLEQLTTS